MATALDLLKKAEARKKYNPQKRRAWDYLTQETVESSDSKQEEYRNNQEQISEQNANKNKDINKNKWEQNSNININISKNNEEQISEQNSNEIGNNNKNELSPTINPIYEQKKPEILHFSSNESDEPRILKTLRKTTGHQQKIMMQITAHFKSMKNMENTINIPVSILSDRIEADKNTIRTSIKRLQKKSILLKSMGERGRHGSTQVIVPNFVMKECLNLFDCIPLSLDEVGYKNENKNRNTDTTYSSSYNNRTTITDLPDDWKKINLEPLKHIGFSETQLKQILSLNINTPEIVQESINHFAYALEANEKYKNHKAPLNVIIGVLRKGQGWFESSYRSPQEIAMEQMIEKKKAERERMKKLEDEAYKLALAEWKETLTTEQLEEIAPAKKQIGDIMPKDIRLSAYFREKVWPLKKADYLIS